LDINDIEIMKYSDFPNINY